MAKIIRIVEWWPFDQDFRRCLAEWPITYPNQTDARDAVKAFGLFLHYDPNSPDVINDRLIYEVHLGLLPEARLDAQWLHRWRPRKEP